MSDCTIKTTIKLEGEEQYRVGIKAICADIEYLHKCIEKVNESVTQLNKSLSELIELRKQSSF